MSEIRMPAAALEAGARALAIAKEGNDEWWTLHMRAARAACLAMLQAWPGMHRKIYAVGGNQIILPLPPQENSDE